MRMSKMGLKTQHHRANEEALSQEILFQATQLKRHCAGIYGLGNLLVRARNKLVDIVRKNLENYDCFEVSLPIIQPKTLWEKSGRWSTYVKSNQMFTFKGRDGDFYCLAPTGEEIVLDFVRENIQSYKDLPINIFQIGLKYRDEIRVHGGLMRSKEFMMKDGYSFHATEEDMVKEYERMRECYKEIFSQLGLEMVVVKAVSAEMGGNNSEEFMCLSNIGEDKILIDEKNGFALNMEILEVPNLLEDFKAKNKNFDTKKLTEKKCVELGHIFQLGRFYSQKMDGVFVNADGQKEPFFMGCYGIGINRTLGAICETNCDKDGLIWPLCIAPYKCSIVYANDFESQANEIYQTLKNKGIEVLLDDRKISFGTKIKDAKLLGLPYLIIVGEQFKKSKKYEIEPRKTNQKLFLDEKKLVEFLSH